MAELTEGTYFGEFIVTEAEGKISRDTVTVTVPAATTLADGTVLGQISATGKYVPYDDGASDGSEVAAGILCGPHTNDGASPADDDDCVIVNWTAEVRSAALVWGVGVSEAAGLADLAALGIKARD